MAERAPDPALWAARLAPAWFVRPPAEVARALVGCVLVHGARSGIIVETEAYLGPEDLASHARFGPTRRSQVLFGPSGITYIYLCYGVHQMFNVVAHREGLAGAVLVRAIAAHHGLVADPAVGRGPGKVTRALALGPAQHGRSLDDPRLFIAAGAPLRVVATPRIGVDFAGRWARRRLRFAAVGHPAVSRPR